MTEISRALAKGSRADIRESCSFLLEKRIPRKLKSILSKALLDKGNFFIRESDFQTAIAYYTISIVMNPRNSRAYNTRGVLRHGNGEIGGALDDFSMAVRIYPSFDSAHVNMSLAFRDIGKLEESMESVNVAIYLNSCISSYYNIRGVIFGDMEEYRRAISEFTRSIGLDGTFATPFFNRGVIRETIGDSNGAMDDFKRAAELDKRAYETYLNLGRLYLKANDPIMSLHNLNLAIKSNPQFAEAYKARAELRFADGNLKGFEQDMERYLELEFPEKKSESAFPSTYEIGDAVLFGRSESEEYKNALRALSLGDVEGAVGMVDSYICMIRTKIESEIILEKGVKVRNMNRPADSIAFFSKAIEFDSESPINYFERGFSKTMIGDHRGAVVDFTTAISLGYRTRDAFRNRGNSRLEIGDYEGAAGDFDSALKFEKDSNLFYLKGYALYKAGDYARAHTAFVSSVYMCSGNAASHYYISLCRFELNDAKGALEACENAIRLDGGVNASYLLHSGALREMLGDYRGAIDNYTIAIKIDPGSAKAYERRGAARFQLGDYEGCFSDEDEAGKRKGEF